MGARIAGLVAVGVVWAAVVTATGTGPLVSVVGGLFLGFAYFVATEQRA